MLDDDRLNAVRLDMRSFPLLSIRPCAFSVEQGRRRD